MRLAARQWQWRRGPGGGRRYDCATCTDRQQRDQGCRPGTLARRNLFPIRLADGTNWQPPYCPHRYLEEADRDLGQWVQWGFQAFDLAQDGNLAVLAAAGPLTQKALDVWQTMAVEIRDAQAQDSERRAKETASQFRSEQAAAGGRRVHGAR